MRGKPVGIRRQASDIEAVINLGDYSMERIPGGGFGIYVRGSRTIVGKIAKNALGLQRALAVLMEAGARPATDRARQKRAAATTGPATQGAIPEGGSTVG